MYVSMQNKGKINNNGIELLETKLNQIVKSTFRWQKPIHKLEEE